MFNKQHWRAQVNGVFLWLSFKAKIWMPINSATRNPENKFHAAKNQGHCPYWDIRNPYTFRPHHVQYTPFSQYTSCFTQYAWCILNCVLTYKESCHKCIRSWYFSWPTLKYTDHYTDLIHPAAPLYLSYINRYTDSVRPEEGSLYRPFYAVTVFTVFSSLKMRQKVHPLKCE